MNDGLSESELEQAISFARINNQVSFSYPCKNACCFCDFRQNGPLIQMAPFLRSYPSTENLRRIVEVLDPLKNVHIDICDNFEVPFIYELIEMIHLRQLQAGSKAKLWIISTFSSFDQTRIEFLKKLKDNLFVDLSLLTFDSEFKNTIMGGGWSEQKTETLKKVIAEGIPNSIAVWYFGDLERFRKDLQIIEALLDDEKIRMTSFVLNYPFSTKYSNQKTKELSKKALSTLDEAIKQFLAFAKKHSTTKYLLPLTDILMYSSLGIQEPFSFSSIQNFSSRINAALSELKRKGYELKDVGFITTALFYKYARQAFPALNWICTAHDYYGGTISCVDLLTFSDILKAINSTKKFQAYVLSKNIISEYNLNNSDLLHEPVDSFRKKIGAELYFF